MEKKTQPANEREQSNVRSRFLFGDGGGGNGGVCVVCVIRRYGSMKN